MCGNRGSSLVELAVIMTFLFPPMLLGTVEFGGLVYGSIEVSNAAHAGAAYAAQSYMASSETPAVLPTQAEVTAAAINDSPELQNMLQSGSTFTATMATGCGAGAATAGNTVPVCVGTALPYVQVTASATVVPLVKLPGFSGPFTLSNTATINLVN
jgi:Flp pilus assembly protein TadG